MQLDMKNAAKMQKKKKTCGEHAHDIPIEQQTNHKLQASQEFQLQNKWPVNIAATKQKAPTLLQQLSVSHKSSNILNQELTQCIKNTKLSFPFPT